MKREDRKAAVAAYKEQKTVAGIVAVRCAASGEQWVGRAGDLSKIQNRIWFALRQGSHPQRSLQAAWTKHGPESFALVELERFEDDEPDFARESKAKERLAHWRAELGAGSF